MVKVAIAAGADSLMIEVHPNPTQALSDGPQSLRPEQYELLMQEIAVIGQVVGRGQRKSSRATVGDAAHQRELTVTI